MKRRVQLRARALETNALLKVGGGRGTACGAQLHCDSCGCVYDMMCAQGGSVDGGYSWMFAGFAAATNCPACGSSAY